MHSDLLLVVLVLVFGCAAFLFGVIYLVCSIIGLVGRGFFRLLHCRPQVTAPQRKVGYGGTLACPRQNCRKVEHRPARYCSQCGALLTVAADRT